jgi:CheY-like chemotaxis protein
MTPEVQARLFEPFFSTKGERGTGLGLAVVFSVVQRHRGQITVESAPGQGSVFRLTFPAATRRRRRPAPPVPAAPSVRPRRILAVDDVPAMGRTVARVLSLEGHAVTVATSGEEAIERLRQEPFDLVISDVGLGAGMNGWELAEHVRRHYPGVWFALATGWGAQIDPEEARARGVRAVIAKPYRAAELQRLVADLAAASAPGW